MGNTESEEKPKTKFKFFQPKQEQSDYSKLKDEVKESCKCSLKTRLVGFGICSLFGWGMEIFAIVSYIIKGDILTFALLFSIGQILNIGATFFLAGPVRQAKNMTHSKRIIVSLVYIFSIIGTLLFAILVPQQPILTIICLIIQIVSYFFYCLSYIPMGQRMLASMCKCCLT